MSSHETAWRYQKAVLWLSTGGFNEFGEPNVDQDNPIELLVRWEDKKFEAVDRKGNVIGLDAYVVVDRDIPVNSLMWKGELADWYGSGSYDSDSELMVVRIFNSTPSIMNRYTRRTVSLQRFRDEIIGE